MPALVEEGVGRFEAWELKARELAISCAVRRLSNWLIAMLAKCSN